RKHVREKNFVEIDNKRAGYIAAEHLIELGHRNIAWIGGSLSVSTYKNRFIGFISACKDYGITIADHNIIHYKESEEQLKKSYTELMTLNKPPTAICGGADSIALDVISFAMLQGKKIPDNLS